MAKGVGQAPGDNTGVVARPGETKPTLIWDPKAGWRKGTAAEIAARNAKTQRDTQSTTGGRSGGDTALQARIAADEAYNRSLGAPPLTNVTAQGEGTPGSGGGGVASPSQTPSMMGLMGAAGMGALAPPPPTTMPGTLRQDLGYRQRPSMAAVLTGLRY